MRLRNIPRAEQVLGEHKMVVKNDRELAGTWGELFENDHPIYIEIGMGKGQFLLNQARENPNINFVGIERYGSVLLRGVEKYDTEEFCELGNVRFLCMDARFLTDAFAPGEVSRIYLNFSDPWPKARHAKRRLPSKEFFSRYDKVLTEDGQVEFKTDNDDLFTFALEQAREARWQVKAHTWDLHKDEEMVCGNIMTEYEAKFSAQGHPIHKMIACRTIGKKPSDSNA